MGGQLLIGREFLLRVMKLHCWLHNFMNILKTMELYTINWQMNISIKLLSNTNQNPQISISNPKISDHYNAIVPGTSDFVC